MSDRASQLRAEILERTRELVLLEHARPDFVAGSHTVPYAGRTFDEQEVMAGVSSMLDFWLTLGPEGDNFERELARFLGVRASLLANSGSSANLLAFSALTSPKLKERRILPGDEVITAACGFPTTVAPIVQNHAIPVFLDCDPLTGNIRADLLEEAYCPGRTKAVMVAHTLGNPFDLTAVTAFCRTHGLWLVEDNCDALGSRYGQALTGTFGDLSTQSFYPPHHVTMGEGGAVNIHSDALLKTLVESFRDWGRDCWCRSGKDNTCKKRFGWQLGELPAGYDHKYIYSHIGYNLKPIDPQAAIGRAQLRKLPDFTAKRRSNWEYLRHRLDRFSAELEFMLPTHATAWTPQGFTWATGMPVVEPSWFGFMILVKPRGGLDRTSLAKALDAAKIGNRMLFGGNLLRQPAWVILREESKGTAFRVVGDLAGADRIMTQGIFVGVYPGLDEVHLDHICATIAAWLDAGTVRAG